MYDTVAQVDKRKSSYGGGWHGSSGHCACGSCCWHSGVCVGAGVVVDAVALADDLGVAMVSVVVGMVETVMVVVAVNLVDMGWW